MRLGGYNKVSSREPATPPQGWSRKFALGDWDVWDLVTLLVLKSLGNPKGRVLVLVGVLYQVCAGICGTPSLAGISGPRPCYTCVQLSWSNLFCLNQDLLCSQGWPQTKENFPASTSRVRGF